MTTGATYAKRNKQWSAALIEAFQTCDIVEREGNLPLNAGGLTPLELLLVQRRSYLTPKI
jgi:hypothetical protein